uniref:NADH-ubiquinone oxidoreductase chain 3 n=1 Tax=Monognathus jesperseni TaxID=556250 RepID=D1YUD3_9TELE|nr:NADH dehydrogenase subunit 3 [Monognathus jesperseni]
MSLFLSIMSMMMMVTSLLMLISSWLPESTPDSEKLSPYECGFDPLGSARLPFSLQFFLVAIMFLLFDLEIALLLPLTWSTQNSHLLGMFLWASLLVTLLTIGLLYEWKQGGLEWAQ